MTQGYTEKELEFIASMKALFYRYDVRLETVNKFDYPTDAFIGKDVYLLLSDDLIIEINK